MARMINYGVLEKVNRENSYRKQRLEELTERKSSRNVPRSRSDFGGWREEKGGKDAIRAMNYDIQFCFVS